MKVEEKTIYSDRTVSETYETGLENRKNSPVGGLFHNQGSAFKTLKNLLFQNMFTFSSFQPLQS